MTAAERRALLGADAVEHARAEALRAATEHPPGEDVLAVLRPILTRPAKRRARQTAGLHARAA
jgi:hypothetical protein